MKLLFRICALVIGIAISFAAAEIGLRIFKPQTIGPVLYAHHPQLGAIHVPNQHGRRFHPGAYDYTYTNNSYGCRGAKEYGKIKGADIRILFLGDSTTYGVGVEDDETFVYRIEQILTGAGISVEAINAGCGGKGTDYSLKFLQVYGETLKPDLVILCFDGNDFYDNSESVYYGIDENGELYVKSLQDTFSAKKEFLRKIWLYDWLTAHSHVAGLLKQTAIKILLKKNKTPGGNKSKKAVISYPDQKNVYLNDKQKKETEILMVNLKREVETLGSRLFSFYIANKRSIELYRSSKELLLFEEASTDICRTHNIDYLSLTPFLSDSKEPISKLCFPLDEHFTPTSHLMVAGFMANKIAKIIKNE